MSGQAYRDPLVELDQARYISFTTLKRDGTPKATPVWITGAGGRYHFNAGRDAWKTKRLRNNAEVEVRVCDVRGRTEPHTAVYFGSGTVLQDTASVRAVMHAVDRKDRW